MIQAPLFSYGVYAPWGKDADLDVPKEKPFSERHEGAGFEQIITFHQKVISLADGPRSHYFPSSSQYMRHAVEKKGLLLGFFLGCDRLLRENSDPWCYPKIITRDGDSLKYDPVTQ